jgi:cell division protein FtsZ
MPGLVNVDFADVKTIMKDAGSALMGIGIGTGEGRAEQAARSAIQSPLLEVSIDGATGILFNIIGGRDLTMKEVDAAARIIGQSASMDANIIFGTTIDDRVEDQVRITVIATGFDDATKTPYGIPREKKAGFSIDQREQKQEPQNQPEKALIGKDISDTEHQDDNKYDIPAFLRGK